MKKFLIAFLVFAICVCAAFSFIACGGDTADNRDSRMAAIYDAYVAYAEENNITPLSYEKWLESVKGQNGKDGKDGIDGKDGVDGKNGVGIADMKIENGKLYVKYTDSDKYVELGLVKGADGKDGANGINGKDGIDGANGKDGINGANGKDGRGIVKSEISGTTLIIYYTDGTKDTLDLSDIIVNPNDKSVLVFSLLPDGTYGVMAGGMAKYNAVIEIPATYNGIEVTQILTEGFANLSSVQKIVLPDSIKTIGNKSFKNCIGLKEINLPTDLERIEQYAFYGCAMIESITIPGNVVFIGQNSFYSSGLTSATFENSSGWNLVTPVKLFRGKLVALDGTNNYSGSEFNTNISTYSYTLSNPISAAKAFTSKVSVKSEYNGNISYEDAVLYNSDWVRK